MEDIIKIFKTQHGHFWKINTTALILKISRASHDLDKYDVLQRAKKNTHTKTVGFISKMEGPVYFELVGSYKLQLSIFAITT